jgi:uncharacterized protein (DUF1015 family)
VQTLPSGHESGLVLAPFRGIRYAPDQVSDIADVTSPPYDVIGSAGVDHLLSADPHNIVRLILPGLDPGISADPASGAATAGEVAAARLREWLASGVLARDPELALYVYEQSAPGWLQRGLIGLVPVGDPDSTGIFPHEGVMPGPVTGRRELMMATRANLEPIFLVYNGGTSGPDSPPAAAGPAPGSGGHGGPAGREQTAPAFQPISASRLVDLTAEQRSPFIAAVTDDGVTHRLWRLSDPAEHAAVAADLAGRTALIADGHHRYAAYRELRNLMRDADHGPGPWDYGLAFLVDGDAYPPRLGAIHRVIPRLLPARAARLAGEAFTVTDLPGADIETAMLALADAGRDDHAFLLAGRDSFRLLCRPDADRLAEAMPAEASDRWRSLDAAVMRELLFARLWGIKDNERDVLIFHDVEEAVQTACEAYGTAVIANPVPFAAVRQLAAQGERVPRKSTSFGPKPRTGLIFRTFEP